MKKLCGLFFAALLLALGSISFAEKDELIYAKGDRLQDFTFTTYDGQQHRLYDILQEKEAVLINLWATWCGPCRNEFPYLEEAYRQYQDRVEIIALSCEPSDSNAVLKAFADQYGLTFMIGQDPVGFLEALRISSIPTTLMIDRFGTICFLQSGAQPDTASFIRLFDAFLGDEYTRSILLNRIPEMRPNVKPDPVEALAQALGTSAAFYTGYVYNWPMKAIQFEGRDVLWATNTGRDDTTSAVSIPLEANAGDVIAVTFKTSTQACFDLLKIELNGRLIKVFGGEHDWMTYAIPVDQQGMQRLTLSYEKDGKGANGADNVWIDTVQVLSEDAAAALAMNPPYPVSDKTTLIPKGDAIKEIYIQDPNGLLAANFGPAKYYIVNNDNVTFHVTASSDIDPEAAFLFRYYDGKILPLSEYMSHDGCTLSAGVDALETTGYTYAYVALYPDASGQNATFAVYFRNEKNVDTFVKANRLGLWQYTKDESLDLTKAPLKPSMATYTIRCIDQYGQPVPGAMLQVCDEETCQVFFSDDNGLCEFTAAAYAWEIHVLKAPTGYQANTSNAVHAPIEGGEIVFAFTK